VQFVIGKRCVNAVKSPAPPPYQLVPQSCAMPAKYSPLSTNLHALPFPIGDLLGAERDGGVAVSKEQSNKNKC